MHSFRHLHPLSSLTPFFHSLLPTLPFSLLFVPLSLSLSLSLQIKNQEQANRMEIYQKTVSILGPEVNKAKEMMRFVFSASTRFCDEVRTLAHPEKRKDFISETYLLTLAKLINMFATLDALKNMKACVNNDLACYKRSVIYQCIRNLLCLHVELDNG